MESVEKCYNELANAIIIQAAEDYIYLLKTGKESMCKKESSKYPITREELERFFKSRLFGRLTTIDPDYFMRKMKATAIDKKKRKYRIASKIDM